MTLGFTFFPFQAPKSLSSHIGEAVKGDPEGVRRTVGAEDRNLTRDFMVQSLSSVRTYHMDSDEWKRAEVCPGA